MLKVHPKFGVWDYSLKKVARSLLRSDFISYKVLLEWYELYGDCSDAEFAQYILKQGLIKYRKVTPSTAPPKRGGFPSLGGSEIYYDVEGEDAPMSFWTILDKYRDRRLTHKFVAICRNDAYGKLELTGFIY